MISSYLLLVWIMGALFWTSYAIGRNIKATYPRALRIVFWPFVIAWGTYRLIWKSAVNTLFKWETPK